VVRNLIMIGLIIVGMIAISYAKILFQKRQAINADNAYSKNEQIILYFGYMVMGIAFIIAAFIKF
jgi:hypothetical protein